jgi:hypothetical protein
VRWLPAVAVAGAVALGAGAAACKNPSKAPPVEERPVMPASEIKRGQDACQTYVEKACACAKTVAALQQPCTLARAYPDAMQVSLDVAANPESTRRDVVQAHDSVRKIVKQCIEETARLPVAGCP